MKFVAATLLAGSVLAAAAPPVLAQSSIKVVVNGEPITTNEIGQRSRLLALFSRTTPGTEVTRKATEELVEERLKLQEAKRVGVAVTDQEVDKAFAGLAERIKVPPAALAQGLKQQGVDAGTLKTRLRVALAWQQLVVARFRKTVTIADSQVVAALAKIKDDKKVPAKDAAPSMVAEYTLQHVIFVVPAARRAQIIGARKKEAEALRAKVTGCDTLLAQTRAYKEVVVKPIGKRVEDEVPENMKPGLGGTAVGRLTPPAESPGGLEMLAVCDKREIRSDAIVRAKVEDDLRQKEGLLLDRRYINDLKRIAVIEYR